MTLEQRAERYALGSKLINDLLADKWNHFGAWLSLGAVVCFGGFFAILLLVH